MLMKLGCGIVRAASLHPLATTNYDKMEEEVKTATATFDIMLQRYENLNTIYEKKNEFSEISITLV